MLVRAKEMGFHGCRRRPGDVFEVPDGQKGKWFEPIDGVEIVEEKPRRSRKPKDDAPQTFSELSHIDGDALHPNLTN